MQLFCKSDGKRVVLSSGSCLGVGGEARVFLVASHPALVAKVYHKPGDQYTRKLEAMLANPPRDPTADQGHASIAWPVDLLTEEDPTGRCVGFLMPRVTDMLRILDFFHPRTRRAKCPLFSYLYLHRTARNLAACFHALHEKNYVVGDVNESNILVKETALVTLVDTDSFQIPDSKGVVIHRCPVGKPDYTPRELHGRPFDREDRLPEHDRFGLAVLLFQLLMEGTHPFAGVYQGRGDAPSVMGRIAAGEFPHAKQWHGRFIPPPGAPELELLHPLLRELFLRCFCEGHNKPGARPTAAEWRDALAETETQLIPCSINEQHCYGKHLPRCPWCERLAKLGGTDPFPSQQAVQNGLHLEPVTPVQTPLPTPTKSAPPKSQPAPSPSFLPEPEGPLQPFRFKWSDLPLPDRATSNKWPWLVAVGLAASWGYGLFSGAWNHAGWAGLAVTLGGLVAAQLARTEQSPGLLRQPVLWCCCLSVLLQLGFHYFPDTLRKQARRLNGLASSGLDERLLTRTKATEPAPAADIPNGQPSPANTERASLPPSPEAATTAQPTNLPLPELVRLAEGRFTNSLGMVFAPVPKTNCPVLVSVWETRCQDYEPFLQATGTLPPKQGLLGSNFPMVNVSWHSATSFCHWLTARERAAGLIQAEDQYRLPSEDEWEAALGVFSDPYPWGPQWPAPDGAGNYEARWRPTRAVAPVGSFLANELGIFDLGGNVWEWSLDVSPQRPGERRLCGGSYRTSFKESARLRSDPGNSLLMEKFGSDIGFRVVLETRTSREFVAALPRQPALLVLPPPTANHRWANSLGMRFLPLPNTKVLFAIWETRVRDYALFTRASGLEHQRPRFAQSNDHPVVNVNWEDALAFCRWLTLKEQTEGRISRDQRYRLPGDLEWSHAVGLPAEDGPAPIERHGRRSDYGFPWGSKRSVVPPNFANYSKWDAFEFTAPVGSFVPNGVGLFDLSGNVLEWCQDQMTPGRAVLRGGCYADPYDVALLDPLLSAYRGSDPRTRRSETTGFRIVLELDAPKAPAVSMR